VWSQEALLLLLLLLLLLYFEYSHDKINIMLCEFYLLLCDVKRNIII
jgi:hypothetical protein